MQLADGRVP